MQDSHLDTSYIDTTWQKALLSEFSKTYWTELEQFIINEYKRHAIFPTSDRIFNCFSYTPLDSIKVVILGQDPYHKEGQAHGLSFSVPHGIKIPPSLQNIYKEIASDIGGAIPNSGNLEHWAQQGVLLLNSTLTVQSGNAGSHQKKGWEQFTDTVIQTISDKNEHVVFMLWGNYARGKKDLIDTEKHLVLEAPHPSPLSAHRGFLGCGHFSKTNTYLKSHNKKEIVWL